MLKPPPPYRLRSMRLADIHRVMTIEIAVFPVPWKAHAYEYEISRNRLASYQVLTEQQGDQRTEVIGYGGYWMMAGEAHISTIAVDPSRQNHGLGQLLLLNMLLLAYRDDAYLATLEVRRNNVVAQALYHKYRFLEVGERKRYYQGKEDALIMTIEPLDQPYRSFLRQEQQTLFQYLKKNRNIEAGYKSL